MKELHLEVFNGYDKYWSSFSVFAINGELQANVVYDFCDSPEDAIIGRNLRTIDDYEYIIKLAHQADTYTYASYSVGEIEYNEDMTYVEYKNLVK
ncbi:hypothetical protein LAX75_12925 [Listeria cossartiae]|uniref:hypothetical protein n=1 Tax=Listeria cossartiae TaxID=2838249 RepID=UPI001E57AF2C|nr:hypothetical protein [Listeria cossartiae]MCD2225518.1 hypothetical protein [Listeria cossartiae]MCD2240269.1 hypothetical protein [Listeria cossartiae]